MNGNLSLTVPLCEVISQFFYEFPLLLFSLELGQLSLNSD